MASTSQSLPHRTDISLHLIGWFLILRFSDIAFLPSTRHISTNLTPAQLPQIMLTAITRIRRDFLSLPSVLFSNLIQYWHHLMHVAAIRCQMLRHDDLAVGIHCCLCVVALNKTFTPLHDATFRIGEVALRLLFGGSCGFALVPGLFGIRRCF